MKLFLSQLWLLVRHTANAFAMPFIQILDSIKKEEAVSLGVAGFALWHVVIWSLVAIGFITGAPFGGFLIIAALVDLGIIGFWAYCMATVEAFVTAAVIMTTNAISKAAYGPYPSPA